MLVTDSAERPTPLSHDGRSIVRGVQREDTGKGNWMRHSAVAINLNFGARAQKRTARTLAIAWVAVLALPLGVRAAYGVSAEQDTPLVLADAPSFDVASVKPSPPDVQFPGIRPIQGARFTAVGLTVRVLFQLAYGSNGALLGSQVVGGPEWIDREHFDIIATSERLLNAGQFTAVRGLLQKLLQERFSARVHVETRELPIYALVFDRADGRPGPRLGPPLECPSDPKNPGDATPNCGFQLRPRGEFAARSIPLALFAANLANLPEVGRVVQDRTGLQRGVSLEVKFTPQSPTETPLPDGPPNIFTALREQLGLRLEPARAPVPVVVIDRIERPTPD